MKIQYSLLAAILFIKTISASNVDEPPIEQFCDTEEPECRVVFTTTEDEPTSEEIIVTISSEKPYRLLTNKDPNGWNVELDDGSVWRAASSSDAYEMKNWRVNDTLVIHPTAFPNWSGGRFFIVNERLNRSSVVELSQGPILNRSTNNQITYIDYSNGYLELHDGAGRISTWTISYADRAAFQKWKPNQSVIIGSNEDCYAGWLSNQGYILINVERNDFVNANLN